MSYPRASVRAPGLAIAQESSVMLVGVLHRAVFAVLRRGEQHQRTRAGARGLQHATRCRCCAVSEDQQHTGEVKEAQNKLEMHSLRWFEAETSWDAVRERFAKVYDDLLSNRSVVFCCECGGMKWKMGS